MAKGNGAVARWLLQGIGQVSLDVDIAALTNQVSLKQTVKGNLLKIFCATKNYIPSRLRASLKPSYLASRKALTKTLTMSGDSQLQDLYSLRTQVKNITLPPAKTEWGNYYENHFPSFTERDDWRQKEVTVYQILSEIKPKTVLDMGSNRGWFSQLAAILGSDVVAFDVDAASIAGLYADAKNRSLSVLPLLMDFRFPTPGTGLGYEWRRSATERLKCDLVMGIAIDPPLSL